MQFIAQNTLHDLSFGLVIYKKKFFFCLLERQNILHLLVHFPYDRTGWGWVRLKLGQICVGGRSPGSWAVFHCAFPEALDLQKAGLEAEQSQHSDMGCRRPGSSFTHCATLLAP